MHIHFKSAIEFSSKPTPIPDKDHPCWGHGRNQLTNMGIQAKTATAVAELNVVADRGYFSSQEILKCQEVKITPTLPKSATSGAKADGRFGRNHFVYHPEQSEYSCPAGERLKWHYSRIERDMKLHRKQRCVKTPSPIASGD